MNVVHFVKNDIEEVFKKYNCRIINFQTLNIRNELIYRVNLHINELRYVDYNNLENELKKFGFVWFNETHFGIEIIPGRKCE